jgi:NAD+ synthase (glutamine-hydrolysing)
MARLRVAAAQVDLVVGDLDHNARRMIDAYTQALVDEPDLVVFPELAVTGYPPEDLLLRPAFVRQAAEALDKIAARLGAVPAVIGFPEWTDDALYNAAALCADGRVVGVYRKHVLPNHSVFDEERYFEAWPHDGPLFAVAGVSVALSICEDAWAPVGPVATQAEAGAELVVNINASPYYAGRAREREAVLATRARDAGVPLVYVNVVGGQDELVFDGASMVFDAQGRLVARARQFDEDLLIVDVDVDVPSRRRIRTRDPLEEIEITPARVPGPAMRARIEPLVSPVHEVYEALVLGTRDYVRKNGFDHVVIGLSGGIDSALTACIATDALGSDRVTAVLMPSRFSSEGSVRDARFLVDNLGIDSLTIPIEDAHRAFLEILEEPFGGGEPGLAEENLQARIRGTILMALSNKHGWLVLTTGNKSEMATGYSTLYGDMAGGFAVIKDVPKTLVYTLARDRNERAEREVVPEAIIDKPPSAELRPDQRDTDSLPPYDELDPILEGYVERDQSVAELIEAGHDPGIVRRVAQLVDRNEYKRRQAPPGVRVSPKAFGKDRRLPIVNRWRG